MFSVVDEKRRVGEFLLGINLPQLKRRAGLLKVLLWSVIVDCGFFLTLLLLYQHCRRQEDCAVHCTTVVRNISINVMSDIYKIDLFVYIFKLTCFTSHLTSRDIKSRLGSCSRTSPASNQGCPI